MSASFGTLPSAMDSSFGRFEMGMGMGLGDNHDDSPSKTSCNDQESVGEVENGTILGELKGHQTRKHVFTTMRR